MTRLLRLTCLHFWRWSFFLLLPVLERSAGHFYLTAVSASSVDSSIYVNWIHSLLCHCPSLGSHYHLDDYNILIFHLYFFSLILFLFRLCAAARFRSCLQRSVTPDCLRYSPNSLAQSWKLSLPWPQNTFFFFLICFWRRCKGNPVEDFLSFFLSFFFIYDCVESSFLCEGFL